MDDDATDWKRVIYHADPPALYRRDRYGWAHYDGTDWMPNPDAGRRALNGDLGHEIPASDIGR